MRKRLHNVAIYTRADPALSNSRAAIDRPTLTSHSLQSPAPNARQALIAIDNPAQWSRR